MKLIENIVIIRKFLINYCLFLTLPTLQRRRIMLFIGNHICGTVKQFASIMATLQFQVFALIVFPSHCSKFFPSRINYDFM